LFAGVLGLDNLDYAASVLDLARSHGQSRLSSSSGRSSTLDNNDRKAILNTSASGGGGGGSGSDEVGDRQRSTIVGGASSQRHQGSGGGRSMATRLSGPRRNGQAAFGRLSLSVSPQDLRKMIDIINAGRRR